MVPEGLPAFVAKRLHAEIRALSKLDTAGQNEVLGVLWHAAKNADVSRRYLIDLKHLTVAFKRLQWQEEAMGFTSQ